MAEIEKSIDIDLPVSTVYNQWTQFEDFPKFMEGVKEVRQLDDKTLFWRAQIAGKEEEWTAEIEEQEPDNRIKWRSTSGARNDGLVTFDKIGDGRTKVLLTFYYDPEGPIENTGDALGMVSRRVEGDLKRFKKFVEENQVETGAWRGEIHGGQVES
ncbi:MAG: SRPBCC family protein [Chloroflexi bacterium]|nr:SRPBCC family protein [Chloroflexota bacterium]